MRETVYERTKGVDGIVRDPVTGQEIASGDVNSQLKSMLSSIVFTIMDTKQCYPGMIIRDIVAHYMNDSDIRHVMLTDNLLWDDIEDVELEDMRVTWLMMVPITESEYEYAMEHGPKILEERFFEEEIDLADLYRKPVV